MPKGNKEHVQLLQMLTNEWNFEHNIEAMTQGSGQIVSLSPPFLTFHLSTCLTFKLQAQM